MEYEKKMNKYFVEFKSLCWGKINKGIGFETITDAKHYAEDYKKKHHRGDIRIVERIWIDEHTCKENILSYV